jgi:hypothetical protein
MALQNVIKLEKDLWNAHVEFMGVDNDMAEMYAQDRNDVIEANGLWKAGKIAELKTHIDRLDTSIREGVVIAFAEDLGSQWVEEQLGWSV